MNPDYDNNPPSFSLAKSIQDVTRRWLVLLVSGAMTAFASAEPMRIISDGILSVNVDTAKGTYTIVRTQDGKTWIKDAALVMESWSSTDPAYKCEVSTSENDGRQTLTLRCSGGDAPTLRLDLTLDRNEPGALVLRAGLTNNTKTAIRVEHFLPMSKGILGGGKPLTGARVLTSGSGTNVPQVLPTAEGSSANNLLLTWDSPPQRSTMVFGALTTSEFTKWVNIEAPGTAFLEAKDPLGRLVDPGETWWPEDSFVMLVQPENPFAALERYAALLAKASGTPPNLYPFPTVCAWYAGVWKTKGAQDHPELSTYQINTTAGLAKEAEIIDRVGITRYAPVALRLVPDNYTQNNPQGWWDDEHWRMHGLYTEPCETTEKYGKSLHQYGVLAFTYIQPTSWAESPLSQDFRKQHPDWLSTGTKRMLDYSKPVVREHVRSRFAALRGHIDGLMVDYCDDLWTHEACIGGFADPKMTSTAFYRSFFRSLREGIGPEARLHERNVSAPNNDLCLGIMDSQRTAGDTDKISPNLVAIGAKRWYKNRVVTNYDMDSKDLTASWKNDKWNGSDEDGRRMMMTMCYVTSGRLLLANSFRDLDKATLHDLSRIMPLASEHKTARPVDLFVTKGCPRVYDYEVAHGWHQVTLYNTTLPTKEEKLEVPMAGDMTHDGALALDSGASYHVYDFWNDKYAGIVPGDGKLEQTLRPGEARMLALHAVEPNPQFIATDRHIMQGMIDLKGATSWDAATSTLSGTIKVIADDPLRIFIAPNGNHLTPKADVGEISHSADGKLWVLTLKSATNKEIPWSVKFQ